MTKSSSTTTEQTQTLAHVEVEKERPWPKVLIEDWLPAAAIGVECMRERSTGQQPPDKRIHLWWARRPLTVSRAAVLGSLVPAQFPHDAFERLLGFGLAGEDLVAIRKRMDSGERVVGGFGCPRAFRAPIPFHDIELLHSATSEFWGEDPVVLDPMAGGGAIPLESCRLGFATNASDLNPVACSVLEIVTNDAIRLSPRTVDRTREWGRKWLDRIELRLETLFPSRGLDVVHAYLWARNVPCPDTGHTTPLVPSWQLLNTGSQPQLVAVPEASEKTGSWSITVSEVGKGAGRVRKVPPPTVVGGKGVSLFTGRAIPGDYIKAMANAGRMEAELYALIVKTAQGFKAVVPSEADLGAVRDARDRLGKTESEWRACGVIPTEELSVISNYDRGHRMYGMRTWCDFFNERQLYSLGVIVDEYLTISKEIVKEEERESAWAIRSLLAFSIDKFLTHNSRQSRWDPCAPKITNAFERHNFSFKWTFAEMPCCGGGVGLRWAIKDVVGAAQELWKLPRAERAKPVVVCLGSAEELAVPSESVSAVVVDPPYADNVQYGELSNFFYVWMKRTIGARHPEWFATQLCDQEREAVENPALIRQGNPDATPSEAREAARARYQALMTNCFAEARRVLRRDGVLTVMFTHKKQEAWEALFASLIGAGFTITATWPVKTESEHSLHQARKNAAQSTVLLVARKRPDGAGVGYFDTSMRREIAERARSAAGRLESEGLNPVDQLVGSFGPAMAVFSRYDEVRYDTGGPVSVDKAIDEASDAVSQWRIERIAERGLGGVEAEGQFYLLCWDVLGAAEFRFNEAKLLGHAVGMDVGQLVTAGLVSKTGDKIKILSAMDRRRARAVEPDKVEEILFGEVVVPGRRRKKDVLKVHPNDPAFRTALDACHALALRHIEAGGGNAGVGNARALARQQGWGPDSKVARLMEALVCASPEAVRQATTVKSAAANLYPEFRAWHALMPPLFGIEAPDWSQPAPAQPELFTETDEDEVE